MFRVYVKHPDGSMTDRTTHTAPGDAVTAWTALCLTRTPGPASAVISGPNLSGSRCAVLREARLDADWPDPNRVLVDEEIPGAWPGLELRAIRKLAGLTQVQFAKEIHISSNVLAMQERGECGVGNAVLALARYIAPALAKAKNAAQPA